MIDLTEDSNLHTVLEIANWILAKVRTSDEVFQEELVYEIQETFGDEFVYENENGNLAINRKVLNAFTKVSGDEIVWERGTRLWRLRQPGDEPGRQQY